MTRQEIKQMLAKNAKEIYCGEDKTVYNEKGLYAIENAIIALQNERLKEFVEWYKKVLVEDYEDKAKQARKSLQVGSAMDLWFYDGQRYVLQRLITLLDRDLEKFLEETSDDNK